MMTNNPYLPTKHKIIKIINETETDRTFRVKANGLKPDHGQFFQVSLPMFGEAPIGMSDFADDWIELTIRKVGSLTEKIFTLKERDDLYLRGPYGSAWPYENEFKGKHLVIAAGGTGVSPVRSMLNKYIEEKDQFKNFDVFMGFRDPYNVLYKEELVKWRTNFKLLITVDKTCDIWTGDCVGLITDYVIKLNIDNMDDIRVVVVGPPIMMKFTIQKFLSMGIPKNQIWISNERRMSCGVGKCGHCKIADKYVCIDGPVFNLQDAEYMID